MGLQSNLSSNKRRPVVAHSFDFTSGARGLVTVNRAIVVVGVKSAAGTAVAGVPVQAFNEADCDLYAGKGSELALAGKSVFKQWRKMGLESAAAVWLCAVAAPAGVAATYTFTVTGTATRADDVVFRIAGRTLRAAVALGDTQNTIASSIKSAIDAMAGTGDLPGTGSVATNVATFTYPTTGVNGNDVAVSVVSAPPGVTVVAAAAVAGTGVASYVTALDALGARDYDSIINCNHAAQDVTDLGTHMDAMWASTRKRWRWAFLGHRGTVAAATTLASPANRPQIVVSAYEDCPNLPGEIAAAIGCIPPAFDRPNTNYDATELWLYTPPDASVFLDSEVETLLAGGVTPITVTDTGTSRLERLVTTKITDNSAPFENLLDLAVSYTMAYYSRQADVVIKRVIKGENLDEELLDEILEQLLQMLRQGEAVGDLHKVDEHKAELLAAAHASIPTRGLVEIPESVVPNCHQIDATHRLFFEGAR